MPQSRRMAMERGPQPLVRQLALMQTTTIALSAMIGAGIYVMIGVAAGITGGSLLLALCIGAVAAILNGLSAAELGVCYPQAGGTYHYARQLLGPSVGYAAGWLYLVAGFAAGGALAQTFAGYLESVFPGLPPRGVGMAAIVAATGLQLFGVRVSARAMQVLVGINLIVLTVFVVVALQSFAFERLQPFLANGVLGLAQASAMLFFAFAGFERPTTIAEEIRKPERTLPRAVILAIALVSCLYLIVALAALGAVGPQALAATRAPLRLALEAHGARQAATIVSLGALIATLTVVSANILGLSRLVVAMARCRDLPWALCRLSEGQSVPRHAVLAIGGLLATAAAVLELKQALATASLALLLYFTILNRCALYLPCPRRLYPAFVPKAGLAVNVSLALILPNKAFLALTVAGAIGAAYYAWLRHKRTPPERI